MRIIGFTFLLLILALTGCAKTGKTQKSGAVQKPPVSLREENAGADFQAFVGRLRKAVKAHDVNTLTSMMTEDFGYRLEPVGSARAYFNTGTKTVFGLSSTAFYLRSSSRKMLTWWPCRSLPMKRRITPPIEPGSDA